MRIVVPLILSSLCIIAFMLGFPELSTIPVDSGMLFKGNDGWFHLVQFSWNGHLGWRLPPFLSSLFTIAGAQGCIAAIVVLCNASVFFFFAQCEKDSHGLLFFAPTMLSVAILSLFGADVVLWGVMLTGPLCWIVIPRFLAAPSFLTSSAILITSVLLSLTANQFALLMFLLPLIVLPNSERALKQQDDGRAQWMHASVFLLCISICVIPIVQQLVVAIPEYPFGGHVARSYGTKTGLWPLIGLSHAEFQIVEREFLVQKTYPLALIFLPVSALVLLYSFLKRDVCAQAVAAVVLAVALLLDSGAAGAEWVQISPLATLSRLIPGLFSTTLVPIATFLLVMFLINCTTKRPGRLRTISLVVLSCLTGYLAVQGSAEGRPYFVRKNAADVAKAAKGEVEIAEKVFSPSYPLFRDHGLKLARLHKRLPDYSKSNASLKRVTTSANTELTHLLFDRDPATRWHPVDGQKGKEWILVEFKHEEPVSALRLNPGNFQTDFPGGIEVRSLPRCCETQECFLKGEVAFHQDPWEGALAFTREGFPYYTHQGKVEIRFVEPVSTTCLLIKQVAPYRFFDWSVAELEVAVEGRSVAELEVTVEDRTVADLEVTVEDRTVADLEVTAE